MMGFLEKIRQVVHQRIDEGLPLPPRSRGDKGKIVPDGGQPLGPKTAPETAVDHVHLGVGEVDSGMVVDQPLHLVEAAQASPGPGNGIFFSFSGSLP